MEVDWDDLRLVAAVARAPSLRRAAAGLGVHASTVTRRLERLERDLGATLFLRDGAGLVPTPAGRALLDRVARVAAEVEAIEHDVAGADGRLAGLVTLDVAEPLALAFLMDELGVFAARHPQIVFDFAPRADVSVALTGAPDERRIGRSVGRSARADYATEEYLAAHAPEIRHHLELPSLALGLAAARSGLGLVDVPCCLGDATPGLVAAGPPDRFDEVWILVHPDLRGVAAVRQVTDFVAEALSRHENALLGGSAAAREG